MALYRILSQNCYEVSTLFTVIDGETGRIPMHEVHLGLLQRQCQCLGVPLTVVTSAQDLSAEEYGERMSASMQVLRSQDRDLSLWRHLSGRAEEKTGRELPSLGDAGGISALEIFWHGADAGIYQSGLSRRHYQRGRIRTRPQLYRTDNRQGVLAGIP